jgi:hypothetical protein
MSKYDILKDTFQKLSDENLVSLGVLIEKLKKDFKVVPTRETISNWTERTEAPKITNFAKLLNPKGGIMSGIYLYDEVKYVVENFYKKDQGRKKAIDKI